MMYTETIKLESVITDIAAGPFGSNLKVSCFVDYGFPIIDGANLKGFKVTDNVTKFVTEEKARSLHRSIAKRNDVIVTISGTLGQIAYIPENSMFEEYLCSQRQFRVSFDTERVFVPYLVYYFHSREGQHKILSFANQTGVPALSQPLKNFRNIEVDLPDIDTQKQIASVMLSLDDKIELNTAINENLEQQIQTILLNLIKSDSQKDSIENVKLGDYLYIKGRIGWKGLKKDEYLESSDYRIINGESLTKDGIDWRKAGYISAERYDESPEIMLQTGDILLSNELLKQSIKSDGVINLFSDKKQDFSLFDPQFLEEISKMKEKNLAVELLKRLIAEQVHIYKRTNLVKSEKFSEIMQSAMNRYLNGMLTNEEVIQEMLNLAKQIREAQKAGEDLGLTADELAFYDALTKPQAIKDFYENEELIAITKELADTLRRNRTIDWQKRESARARMRMMIKKLLKSHRYPPEGMDDAVATVMQQCELWADNIMSV